MHKSIKVLLAIVASLVVLNSVTIVVLLRQRSEIMGLRAQGFLAGRADQEPAAGATGSPGEAAPLEAKRSVNIVLAEVNQENGLTQAHDTGDGLTRPATIDGVPCRELARPGGTLAKIISSLIRHSKKPLRSAPGSRSNTSMALPTVCSMLNMTGRKLMRGVNGGEV